MANGRIWTIARNGKELISFTTFVETKVGVNSSLLTEMVAPGSFSTYDRAISPSAFSVQLSKEGTDDELNSVHIVLERLRKSTEIFSIITPDYEYKNLCLQGYSYKRDEKNAKGFITVDLDIAEIKIAPNPSVTQSDVTIQQNKEPSCTEDTKTGQTNTKEVERTTRDNLAKSDIDKLKNELYDDKGKLKTEEVRKMSAVALKKIIAKRQSIAAIKDPTLSETFLFNMCSDIIKQWVILH